MSSRSFALFPLLAVSIAFGQAVPQFPPQIKNVIVIFQENRTPDNLFHFLTPACPLPQVPQELQNCIPIAAAGNCYDVSPCGISNQSGTRTPIELKPISLSAGTDPDHTHTGFDNMCDPSVFTTTCRNDGAWKTTKAAGAAYAYVDNTPVTNSDGTAGHILDPYLSFAKNYGWANYMYQTNQGPSYPAHQYIFSGTSAPSAEDDADSNFVGENFNNNVIGNRAGCLAPQAATNTLISPAINTPPDGCKLFVDGSVQECTIGNTALIYPTDPVGTFCYSHRSMADVLDPHAIEWKYYAPKPGSIWTAPDSFKAICEPAFSNVHHDPNSAVVCTGKEWNAHVDTKNLGTNILRDIAGCSLAQVSWVNPDGRWSDHGGISGAYGPSWVAAIINAIGNSPRCPAGTPDAGQKYWENTAIVVTWDDWGGWSDNQPPPHASALPCRSSDCKGDYEYGFRVPLIVVSAYTPAGTISDTPHDFGSVLRMIEGVNHLAEGQLGFADARATTDLSEFFKFMPPREYQTVPAEKDKQYFLLQHGAAIDPDDD